MANTWTPSEAGGIPRETPLTDTPGATGLPWDRAPEGSHVWGFRFYDARKYGFLRKFGADATRGQSQLQVRFRDATGALTSEYWYFFPDHDRGKQFYEALKAAPHPGEVVNDLRAAGVAYQKQGQF